jgi:hypothetical protein
MKIVRILDEYRVLVDHGMDDGARIGQKLIIKQEDVSVVDYDTNEFLGAFSIIKATLEIKEIYSKICVCVNADKQKTFFEPIPLRLNVDASQISGPEIYSIRIGDTVESCYSE